MEDSRAAGRPGGQSVKPILSNILRTLGVASLLIAAVIVWLLRGGARHGA